MAKVNPRRLKAPKIVQPGNSGPYWIAVLVALLLLGWSYVAFDYGRQQAGFHSSQALRKQRAAQEAIVELTKERDALKVMAERHERGGQIDRDAARLVQDDVKELQNEKARLKREIAFLRELVSAGDGALRVRDFQLQSLGNNRYRYRLTVVQAVEHVATVRGRLRLSISGLADGQGRTYELAELSTEGRVSRKLRFKNFQDVEGVLKLPNGFSPSTVTIEIDPEGRELKPLQHIVDWRVTEIETDKA